MITVRKVNETKEQAKKVNLGDACSKKYKDHYVEWSVDDDFRVIDIDIKEISPETDNIKLQAYEFVVKAINDKVLRPIFFQRTKNGGMHLICSKKEAYLGHHLLKQILSSMVRYITDIEVLTKFRNYGNLQFIANKEDTPILNRLEAFPTYVYVENSAKLEELKEKYRHGRHPHSDCPFNPTSGKDLNPSVVVNGDIITCYRCHRSTSISALMSGRKSSLLKTFATKEFPWLWVEHEFIRQDLGRGTFHLYKSLYSRELYKCMLQETRGEFAKWKQSFSSDFQIYLSCENKWIFSDGRAIPEKDLEKWLARLPFLNYVDDEYIDKFIEKAAKKARKLGLDFDPANVEVTAPKAGKLYSKERVITLKSCIPVVLKGLPRFEIRKGQDYRKILLEDEYPKKEKQELEFIVYPNHRQPNITLLRKLKVELNASKTFAGGYLGVLNGAVDTIKEVEGIEDFQLEHVLVPLLARLSVDKGLKTNPLIVLNGGSGTGKSTISRIVTKILGYEATEISGVGDPIKVKRSYDDAVIVHDSVITVDEGLKQKDANFYLDTTKRNANVRPLYHDSYMTKNKAITIINGISVPASYVANKQFMRRATILPELNFQTANNSLVELLDDPRENNLLHVAVDSILFVASHLLHIIPMFSIYGEFNSILDIIEEHKLLGDMELRDKALNDDGLDSSKVTELSQILKAVDDQGCWKESGKNGTAKKYVVTSDKTQVTTLLEEMTEERINEVDWSAQLQIKNLVIKAKKKRRKWFISLKIKGKPSKLCRLSDLPALQKIVNEKGQLEPSYVKDWNITT